MKRLLCVILTLVCILSFSSCNLLDKFISTEPEASPTTTSNNSGETVPEKAPEATTPESTTPEDVYSGETTPPTIPPENPPETNTVTVQIAYQTGGVHRVESVITATSPVTLLEVYNLFANEHPYESFNNVECYLNDKSIDPTQTVYMQDDDRIYLQESGDGYHLHIWEVGMGRCRICFEECPHEWEGVICRMCKSECYHKDDWSNGTWANGQCEQCGTVCRHEQWNDNGQCTVCGFWMGVNLIEIEIYENGEYVAYTQIDQITLRELIMAYYGYSWDYMIDSYEFFYNNVYITEGSHLITESGRLDIVTRRYYE